MRRARREIERCRQREQTGQTIAKSGRQSKDARDGAAIRPQDEEITADHAVGLETDQPGCRRGVDRRGDPLRARQQWHSDENRKHNGDRQKWQRAGARFECTCGGDVPDENKPGDQRQGNRKPNASACRRREIRAPQGDQRPVTMAMMIAGRMIDTAAPYNDKYDASSWRMADLLGLDLTSYTIVTIYFVVNSQAIPLCLLLSYSR